MLAALDYALANSAAFPALVALGYWEGADLSHVIAFLMGQERQHSAERAERHRRARSRRRRRARR